VGILKADEPAGLKIQFNFRLSKATPDSAYKIECCSSGIQAGRSILQTASGQMIRKTATLTRGRVNRTLAEKEWKCRHDRAVRSGLETSGG